MNTCLQAVSCKYSSADRLKRKVNISGWGSQEQFNEVGGILDGSWKNLTDDIFQEDVPDGGTSLAEDIEVGKHEVCLEKSSSTVWLQCKRPGLGRKCAETLDLEGPSGELGFLLVGMWPHRKLWGGECCIRTKHLENESAKGVSWSRKEWPQIHEVC